ncbi:hypothetical protein N7449_002607 [Penicillium cf. viridicatum]|uniref:Uncharacterized protein n=1 Tax=Penicillium cf. viridicatum TaxID=2972119 RepID=A0A9W9MVF7_9EURO|nr:hypothetical protein N7449_002607 [Penicillium cf. viridicatum]
MFYFVVCSLPLSFSFFFSFFLFFLSLCQVSKRILHDAFHLHKAGSFVFNSAYIGVYYAVV